MPVRMTGIIPQAPSGVVKPSVDVGDIIAETSFDAELELTEVIPVEVLAESPDFTPIGHILRKIIPLEVRIEEAPAEPPNIEAKPPVKNPVAAEVVPEVRQQVVVAQSITPEKDAPAKVVGNESQKVETIPMGPLANTQIPEHASARNVTEKPSIPEIPFAPKTQSDAPRAEKRADPTPEKQTVSRHAFVAPEISAPRSVLSASPSVGSTTPDTASDNPPEIKLQKTSEVYRDFSDFGVTASEKSQLHRPLHVTTPMAPATANKPQATEAKIISQISSAISNTSKDTVEIRLDPPELGRVIISITQSDSGLTATVTSEKAEVADLLRRHAELLSRELSKSGFGEASLEFSHKDQHENRSDLEEGRGHFSPATSENNEVASTIEMILQSQSGSLDIRL